MSYVKRWVLSRGVEVSGVLKLICMGVATRQRGVTVSFLDDPQGGGGADRRVVCFDDPRVVFLHADRGVVTDPASHSVGRNCVVRVYGEATLGGEAGVKSDEYGFDGRPSFSRVVRVQNRAGVKAVGYAIIVPFYWIVWVRGKDAEGVKRNSLRYDIFWGSMLDGMVSFASRSLRSGFVSEAGRFMP